MSEAVDVPRKWAAWGMYGGSQAQERSFGDRLRSMLKSHIRDMPLLRLHTNVRHELLAPEANDCCLLGALRLVLQ